MASIVILLIIAACAAFQYLKGSITRGVATIFVALIASFLAFGYYEWLAVFLSGYVASVGPWAQLICYALLFVIGFALLQTGLTAVLRDPIDLGDLAEKIGRPICGVILGMIISGVVVTAVALAPLPAKYPYARFNERNPDAESPQKSLLNTDGMVTGLFSMVSKGSFKAISKPRSFSTLHASFLDQIFLNRHGIDKNVPPQAKSGTVVIELPRKAAAWMAPDNLTNLAGETLPGKPGHQGMIVRMGMKRSAGVFTPSQIRVVCKPKGEVADALSGTGTAIYPAGYMYNATQVDVKRLGDKIEVKKDDFDGQSIRWIDFLFHVPGGQVPVLAQFKLDNADRIPRPVSGDDVPPVEGFGPGLKKDTPAAETEPQNARANDAYQAERNTGTKRRSDLSDISKSVVGGVLEDN